MKKYEFTGETKIVNGVTLCHIVTVRDFSNVHKGDFGGWIESEENLSQDGNCWVYDNAQICGNGKICGDARIYEHAKVCDNAQIYGDAEAHENDKNF